MNSIVKVASRLSTFKHAFNNPLRQMLFGAEINITGNRQITRSLWHMTTKNEFLNQHNQNCICGCRSAVQVHTKAEKDLVDFLTDEISTEKKTQPKKGIPSELDGFKVDLNGSEVTLTKKSGNESVIIYFNVNHSVDADVEADINPNMDKPELAEMKSKPGFEVELVRGKQTLGFTCSFLDMDSQGDEEYNDVFSIDEVTMYEGEWSEKIYGVSGEILDANLYDLLMNLLEEKGVSNEFTEKLSDFSTAYEHYLYVGLLEKLQKFVNVK